VKVRLYHDDPLIEFDVRTDQIDVTDQLGKDLTVNFYSPDIDNQGVFYTDANGLQMQKRVTKTITTPADVSSSFYPVTSAIVVRDAVNVTGYSRNDQLTVLTSRS